MAGGAPEECLAMAQQVVQDCLDANCGPGSPPCPVACAQDTVQMFQACIENGGNPMQCGMQAQAFLQECLQGCD